MRLRVRDLAMIPVGTALVVALGLLPKIQLAMIPVPITMQTLGVMLAGIILGAWRGAVSQLLVLALVAVGAPVLAGGRGGLAILVGPSAGFLWAWPLGALIIGYLTERTRRAGIAHLFGYNLLGGVAAIYAIGVPVMGMVAGMPLAAAWTSSLAFLPGDLIKAGIAAVLGLAVRRALQMANTGPGALSHGRS